MIKQKKYQKVTALNKKRINIYHLAQRVNNLERQLNAQVRVNERQAFLNDNLFSRIETLEASQPNKGGFIAWLCRKLNG